MNHELRRRRLTGEEAGHAFDYDVYMPDVHAWLWKNALMYTWFGEGNPMLDQIELSSRLITNATFVYLDSVKHWEARTFFENHQSIYGYEQHEGPDLFLDYTEHDQGYKR